MKFKESSGLKELQGVSQDDLYLTTEPLPSDITLDPLRWRLKDDDSRHTWHYLEDDEEVKNWPQTVYDKHFLNLPLGLPDLPTPSTALDSAKNGLSFFENLQLPGGHWGCHSGGLLIFLPGVVFAWHITKTPIPRVKAIAMKNYLEFRRNASDGGWGPNIGEDSNVCCTSLNYAVLRLLGVGPDEPIMTEARKFIHKHGGAVSSSVWGKLWLSTLGVMNWDIVNPIPPEMWLVPYWVPVAPWRFFIELRMAAQSMSYLWSKRVSGEESYIIRKLREELFVQPYDEINWALHRNTITKVDNLIPRTWVANGLNWLFYNVWQPYFRTASFQQKAESWVGELIDIEDANTNYSGIAATNAPMNTIICYLRDGPESPLVQKRLQRLQEFMWVTEDGMLCHSTNGTQCWDTAFLVQAVFKCGLQEDERWRPMLSKAFHYLDRHQIREDCADQDKCHRQPRKGAWAFSNKDQGVAVSDCIAEALKAVLLMQETTSWAPKLLDDQRLFDAVDSILLYQNNTGGVSAFEARRGGEFLEMFNISELFGRFMVDYDYPECTTSCVTALCLFRKHKPEYRAREIDNFITRAVQWIKTNQRQDGSWYGSWGICFTYAASFAMESLRSMGETYATSEASRKGCEFLLSKQREDGGWSESLEACKTMQYVEDPQGSLVVQTAWALTSLLEAEYPHVKPLARAAAFIAGRQQANGEWRHEAIEGCFHTHSSFAYPNYKFTFTIRALGAFAARFPEYDLTSV